MKHKYIIDLEQDKDSKTITIKITGYPLLMGENLFKAFSGSFESFLKIFFDQTKKIKNESR